MKEEQLTADGSQLTAKKNAALFWSGGKDSALALFYVRMFSPELEVKELITTLNPEFRRISMHGVREDLLDRQASAIGLPVRKMWVPAASDNGAYEKELHAVLADIKGEGIDHVIFGDIFLEDLKAYRERMLSEHGLTGVYPLWKKPGTTLLDTFIRNKFAAITCCISSAFLGTEWLGRIIDAGFIRELPATADPCGENGEFHSFCFAGPVFTTPVLFKTGETEFRALSIPHSDGPVSKTGFYYLDLV